MKLRMEKLIKDVAEQFEKASTPMSHEWLCENHVTLDELSSLCNQLGAVIRGFVQAPTHIQMAVLACSAMPDKQTSEHVVSIMERERTTKRLREMK